MTFFSVVRDHLKVIVRVDYYILLKLTMYDEVLTTEVKKYLSYSSTNLLCK